MEIYESFHVYTLLNSFLAGVHKNQKAPSKDGFIVQFVEHRTGNAGHGSQLNFPLKLESFSG